MRKIPGLQVGGNSEVQVTLVTIDAAGEVDGRLLASILFHLQSNITDGNLLIVLMLEHQYAINHL